MSGGPRRVRDRVRPWIYRVLELSPPAYTRYLHWRSPKAPVVTRESAIAIVGYPGSGNTFARVAFWEVNRAAVVASHVHSWTQLAEAVRLRVPAILLIREPLDAVASCLIRHSVAPPRTELQRYARLYERSLRYSGDVVVATFDEVTHHYAGPIERVNRRFGTAFVPFDNDDARLMQRVAGMNRSYDELVLADDVETRTSLPSSARGEPKAKLLEQLTSPELRQLLDRCQRAHDQIRAFAGS